MYLLVFTSEFLSFIAPFQYCRLFIKTASMWIVHDFTTSFFPYIRVNIYDHVGTLPPFHETSTQNWHVMAFKMPLKYNHLSPQLTYVHVYV